MNSVDIVRQRIINQQLAGTKFKTPADVVSWMGAMQAQDYAMVKWAIGVRLPNSTEVVIEQAMDRGEIIRMHMMRPTWHLISARDVKWLLALTSSHLVKSMKSRWKALGLTDEIFKQSNVIIEKSLTKKDNMIRAELVEELNRNKIRPDSLQIIHIMFNAELNGIICSGPMRGKQLTYALLEERVPKTKLYNRDEALAELSKRYFTSHGPATVQDFTWWSGLPAAEAKAALKMTESSLRSEKINNQIFWFTDSSSDRPSIRPIYLLPAYDEFMISYKDRSASLNPKFFSSAITRNGIFRPIIVAKGQVVGTWTREIKNDGVILKPKFFRSSEKPNKKELSIALEPYKNFLSKKVL